MDNKPYKNIISPDIVSYRRYIIIAEYDDLETAKSNLDKDVSEWEQRNYNSSWYKLNYPFAFATVSEPADHCAC